MAELDTLAATYEAMIRDIRRGALRGLGPYLLGIVSRAAAEEFMDTAIDSYPLMLGTVQGEDGVAVWLCGDPSPVTCTVRSRLQKLIMQTLTVSGSHYATNFAEATDYTAEHPVARLVTKSWTLGKRILKEGTTITKKVDAAFADAHTNDDQTVRCVVEIAYNNESVQDFLCEAVLLTQQGLQQGVASRRSNFIGIRFHHGAVDKADPALLSAVAVLSMARGDANSHGSFRLTLMNASAAMTAEYKQEVAEFRLAGVDVDHDIVLSEEHNIFYTELNNALPLSDWAGMSFALTLGDLLAWQRRGLDIGDS